MFNTLDSILGPLNRENVLLCIDKSKGRSGFINHHFISYGIKRHSKVVLIGLDQTFGHYHSVGLKLGYNLLKLKEEGKISFFDGSRKILPSAMGLEALFRVESGLKELFNEITQLLSENCLLIIDNLSVLSALGFLTRDLNLLLTKLTDRVVDLNGKILCTATLGETETFLNNLHRKSDVSFIVEDLRTGKSRDVTGHLNIKRRSEFGEFEAQDFQFRIEEKNVKIFPPGTSAAVL